MIILMNSIPPRALNLLPILVLLAGLCHSVESLAQTRYTYSTDGTRVKDTRTGLVWQRCSQGQTWNGSTCSGVATLFTHEQALSHAKAQAGWRLPNIKELASLVDLSRMNPAMDTTTFPNADSSNYWSSTPFVGDPRAAWNVGSNGVVGADDRVAKSYRVRLVQQ